MAIVPFKHRQKRRHSEGSGSPYPLKFEPKNLDDVRCPECGARTSCYACASSGGWMSVTDREEADRIAGMDPT